MNILGHPAVKLGIVVALLVVLVPLILGLVTPLVSSLGIVGTVIVVIVLAFVDLLILGYFVGKPGLIAALIVIMLQAIILGIL